MALTRRDFIHAGCAAATITLAPNFLDIAEARFPRGSSGSAGPTGNSVINGFSASAFPFKNLFLTSSFWGAEGFLNTNGYPTSASFTDPFDCNLALPSNYFGQFTLTYTGPGPRIQFGGCPANVYSGGANVVGLGGATGRVTNNFTIESNGGSPTVVFDFSFAVTGAVTDPLGTGQIQLTIQNTGNLSGNNMCSVSSVGGVPNANGVFPYTITSSTTILLTGSSFAGTYTSGGSFVFVPGSIVNFLTTDSFSNTFSNLIMVRSSAPYAGDLAAVQSGVLSQMFNSDFITSLQSLNCSVLRFMEVDGINNSTRTSSAGNTPVSFISYGSTSWLPSLWANTISGTDQYAATLSGFTYTQGATGQGVMTTVPQLSSITITGASSGTGGVIRLAVSSTSTLTTGQRIYVSGYNGQSFPSFGEGAWTITVIDGAHIDLTTGYNSIPSVFSQTWTSGGSISTATINVNGLGKKLLVNQWGQTPTFLQQNGQSNGNPCTFIYDSVQDAVLLTSSVGGSSNGGSGVTGGWPLAVKVALCNLVNANYWHNFPAMFDLASVASDTSFIAANLNSQLGCRFEYGNEVWNAQFAQGQWSTKRGIALGFPFPTNNEASYSWVSLRHRQVMGQVTTTWGARSGLRRVLPWQAADSGSANTISFLFNSSSLVGSSFPAYLAFVGGTDPGYNSSPNRAIDFAEDISYAPYYNGAILGLGGVPSGASTADIAALTTNADLYATGTAPNIATALAYVDNDVRSGTINGVSGTQTLSFLASNYYPGWQTASALYTPHKGIILYENAYQGSTITQSQCTSYGISTTYGGTNTGVFSTGGKVYNMLQGYKNSALFLTTVTKQFTDIAAASPTAIVGWFDFSSDPGGNALPESPWGMYAPDLYATPYQSYNALRAHN